MTDRPVLVPDAAHPITIEPTGRRVTVRLHGQVVAETDNALTLRESTYPAAQYLPIDDVAADALRPSAHQTYCPYKGAASYFDLLGPDGVVVENAVWTYATPHPAMAKIAEHVAFYADRVDITVADGP